MVISCVFSVMPAILLMSNYNKFLLIKVLVPIREIRGIILGNTMDDQTQITYIGKVDYRNKMTKFGIKPRDRTKHMYIIGKTGTGKSTFLENMIVQDIQNGHGVAFIDPHGGSADKLLDYIPDWRINDVIYFNPSDMEYPVAFNPLEDPGPEKRHLVTDGLMSVFKKIWPEAFSGRMEYILNMTMMALMEYPDSTVLSINRMLTDKDFRKRVIAGVTDTAVRNAWDELMKWDDKRWSEAIGALINKVGQFSTNPVIRNIIGQAKSTFDFRKAMDERKIVIINLSKGMIGEQNAPLLGAMLITKIYLSAMSRAELPAHVIERMPPFYFYVDEFQNFANESFASILSEARKYKLCLTVANQFIAQMEETIRDAVFGNMGTTVAFRVGVLDAEFMERVFAPVFTQEDLQNIAFGQYYLTLQIDNMGSKPFSAQGLPPIPPLQTSMRNQVIDASRKNYASNREEVEMRIKEFFGYTKKTIHTETVTSEAGGEILAHVSPNKGDVRMSGGTGIYIKPVNPKQKEQKETVAQKPESLQPITIPKSSAKPVQSTQMKQSSVVLTQTQEKLEPVSGYRKEEPRVNSDSLNTLLSRLDDAIVVTGVKTDPAQPATQSAVSTEKKSDPDFKPLVPNSLSYIDESKKGIIQPKNTVSESKNSMRVLTQNGTNQKIPPPTARPSAFIIPEKNKLDIKQEGSLGSRTEINQITQNKVLQNKSSQAPVRKLDRAATNEQKSALQEVLARAMAKSAEKPVETQQKVSTHQPQKQEIPLPEPHWQESEVLSQHHEEQQSIVVPEPAFISTPLTPASTPLPSTPLPSTPAPSSVSTSTPSRTVREVPEDILRRVLE